MVTRDFQCLRMSAKISIRNYIIRFFDSVNGFTFCLASRTACPKQRVDDRKWAHARGGFFCTEAWPGSDCAGEMGIPDDCIFEGDQGWDGRELFGYRHTANLSAYMDLQAREEEGISVFIPEQYHLSSAHSSGGSKRAFLAQRSTYRIPRRFTVGQHQIFIVQSSRIRNILYTLWKSGPSLRRMNIQVSKRKGRRKSNFSVG